MTKLSQNQVYRKGDEFIRIVELDRREVQYKAVRNLLTREGSHHRVSKKEFCRLIKSATLLTQEEVRAIWLVSPFSDDPSAPATRPAIEEPRGGP